MSKKAPTDEELKKALEKLKGEVVLALRDSLRNARARALANAEDSGPLFVAIDQLGKFLDPGGPGLGDHQPYLEALAVRSPLSRLDPAFHSRFDKLFKTVKDTRNDAMHEGVYARHLTQHAVDLALIFEDALMNERQTVGHFMIRSPVVAELWQPLSFVRQNMVQNSFTYLPIQINGAWKLLSDQALATALRGTPHPISNTQRGVRLSMSVEEAITAKHLQPIEAAKVVSKDHDISQLLELDLQGRMVLVVDEIRAVVAGESERQPVEKRLLGILMPFDLL